MTRCQRAGLWALAVLVTLVSAVWQRTTGPTYPTRGEILLGGQPVHLKLFRTHPGSGDLPVRVTVGQRAVAGLVAWRRYPSQDPWQVLPMANRDGVLEASIPHQPPSGKVEYEVRLTLGSESATFPARPAVARFRGEVSPYVLIPHILCMFLGMLFSNKAGLDILAGRHPRTLVFITFALLGVGGFILGPAVQKMAFDAWWTGIPFGHDLTDNKTLIAIIAWGIAVAHFQRGMNPRWIVLIAAVATLVIFAIPHSAWGSQIDWDQIAPTSGTPSATRLGGATFGQPASGGGGWPRAPGHERPEGFGSHRTVTPAAPRCLESRPPSWYTECFHSPPSLGRPSFRAPRKVLVVPAGNPT